MSVEEMPEPFRVAISAMRMLVNRPHWMRASDVIQVFDVMIGNLEARLAPSNDFGDAARDLKTAVGDLAARAAGQEDNVDVEIARQNCRAKIDGLATILQSARPKALD